MLVNLNEIEKKPTLILKAQPFLSQLMEEERNNPELVSVFVHACVWVCVCVWVCLYVSMYMCCACVCVCVAKF